MSLRAVNADFYELDLHVDTASSPTKSSPSLALRTAEHHADPAACRLGILAASACSRPTTTSTTATRPLGHPVACAVALKNLEIVSNVKNACTAAARERITTRLPMLSPPMAPRSTTPGHLRGFQEPRTSPSAASSIRPSTSWTLLDAPRRSLRPSHPVTRPAEEGRPGRDHRHCCLGRASLCSPCRQPRKPMRGDGPRRRPRRTTFRAVAWTAGQEQPASPSLPSPAGVASRSSTT